MTQTFVESCVDFEVAHLSVLMVRRLAYPEIPTLRSGNIIHHHLEELAGSQAAMSPNCQVPESLEHVSHKVFN